MTDTDKLRPEVREAVQELDDKAYPGSRTHERWQIIRAELLRLDALARELNEERGRQAALRFDERIRAEKAEAELAALRHENAQLRDVLADRDMDREMAAHANRELAALKARIAEAPLCDADELSWFLVPMEWADKCVRLVVEE